jgi:hypothetical protein
VHINQLSINGFMTADNIATLGDTPIIMPA